MRCPLCGMVFNNKSGVCPRCLSDVIMLESKNKILYKELFRIGIYSINLLRLYCLIAINAVIGIIIANAFSYFYSDKIFWGIPAIVLLLDGYYLLSLFASSRRNFLRRFRRFVICLQMAALLFQIFVSKNYFASDYIIPALTLVSYAVVISATILMKGKLSQKYISLCIFSLVGLIPFVLVLCGYTSDSIFAYVFSLAVFVLSLFVFLNIFFFSFLKIKYNVGGLLE